MKKEKIFIGFCYFTMFLLIIFKGVISFVLSILLKPKDTVFNIPAIYRYFKTVVKHKYYVGQECFASGLYWQGIVHDLSKLSYIEFLPSAIYFEGSDTTLDICSELDYNYSIAWLYHKARNKHHWEYWVDFTAGEITCVEMPEKYVKEMMCDFIGAGKVYNKGKVFDKTSL